MQATKTKTVDELIAYVVKHPIRIDALAILNEREASPSQIAKMVDEPISKVGNHIRALADAGCIELVRTAQGRGGSLEHFYRASLRGNISDEAWAKLSRKERAEISALIFQAIIAEGLAALRAGTFDSRLTRHISWRILDLDEEGWDELMDELAGSLTRIEEIQARSHLRGLNSDEPTISVIAAAAGFERVAGERPPRPPI